LKFLQRAGSPHEIETFVLLKADLSIFQLMIFFSTNSQRHASDSKEKLATEPNGLNGNVEESI